MLEEALTGLVAFLAFVGAAALLLRLVRSFARLALRAAEATAAAGLADISARRGDVTAMIERQNARKLARRDRRVAMGTAALWLLWLAVPPFAGVAREAYAIAALLWLVPRQPLVKREMPESN